MSSVTSLSVCCSFAVALLSMFAHFRIEDNGPAVKAQTLVLSLTGAGACVHEQSASVATAVADVRRCKTVCGVRDYVAWVVMVMCGVGRWGNRRNE